MRPRVSTRALDRWRLTLPLALPTLGRLVYLYALGAPARLMAVNAGALGLALAWIMLGPHPASRSAPLPIAVAAVLALFLPLVLGPEVGGVSRWLPAGPVQLHSGALLLPLVTVIAAREPRAGPALLAGATVALGLQPDAASLAGLAIASTTLAALSRSPAFALVGLAAAALAAQFFAAGTLEPQLYTEGVLAHVAEHSLIGAVALGLLLLGVPIWFLVIRPIVPRTKGIALAALLIGIGAAAVIAPFPFPLIGYGASPILGFGLALGAVGHPRQL